MCDACNNFRMTPQVVPSMPSSFPRIYLIRFNPSGYLSLLHQLCLNVIVGLESMTIFVRRRCQLSDLQRAIGEALKLPRDDYTGIRIYLSGGFSAEMLTDDAAQLASESATGHPPLFARCSRIRYVEFMGETDTVLCGYKLTTFLDFRDYLIHHFDIVDVKSKCLVLFQWTRHGHVKVALNTRLPSIDEDPAAGFCFDCPILLRRIDQLRVHACSVEHTISIAGCRNYSAVAEAICKVAFQGHTSPSSLALY